MQIVLLDMSYGEIKVKGIVVASILLLSISRAFACSGSQNQPGQTIDIEFTKNSSFIDGKNMLALANWSVDLRIKYQLLESSSIVGFADEKEKNSLVLAKDRANNVSRLLDSFGIHASSASIIGKIYKPMLPNSKYEPTGTRAEVTLVPGCPNKCCDGN